MTRQPNHPLQPTEIMKALAELTSSDWNWTTFDLHDEYEVDPSTGHEDDASTGHKDQPSTGHEDDPSTGHETNLKNKRNSALRDELETDLERYSRGVEFEKYGRELTELEETYERSRWFRSQAMIANLDKFNQLCTSCFEFVTELTNAGWQARLGNRAGLQVATIDERPSRWIEFKPEFPPELPPLNESDYEKLLGGPHVFGARLLWWCAAAKSPNTFGYSPLQFQTLWTQPFWFQQSGFQELTSNPRPLDLLQQAAIYCLETKELPAKSENDEQIHPNGPGDACSFYWNNKRIDLQKRQSRMMHLLWKNQEKPVPLRKAEDEVWEGEPRTFGTYYSHVSKLTTRFDKEKIPIEVSFKDHHFIMEITKKA